ncbi:MAG: CDP-alcohol phosphatidyltransferase family protein [Parachlamydiales bacterium]|nr:CDP-alcohol phosphatidyltransferase family protein [Parachlamydiales bacterium]
MNIPHLITLSRLLVIPLFPLFYLYHSALGVSSLYMPFVLLVILGFCELSDIFDGYLARKMKIVSDLGKVMDPMADSITRIIVFFTFTQGVISLPLLLVFVFLYREFFISTLRTVCALKGYALAARRSGKIKTVIQGLVSFFIVVLMIPYAWGYLPLSYLQNISLGAVSFAALYSLATGVEYLYAQRAFIKQMFL